MRGKLSIKARITLWYACLILLICAAALAVLMTVSGKAAQTYCSDTLRSAAVVLIDEMEIEHGILEIDSDLEEIPNVYASLFTLDGELIYGRERVTAPFENEAVREIRIHGDDWYIYDEQLHFPDRESVWMRLYLSANVYQGALQAVIHFSIWLLPLLAGAALLGGYLITARAFRPVKEMTALAASIAGGDDLSRRVTPSNRIRDELHALADTLNAMLQRLQQAFDHERQFTSDAAHELRTPLNAMRTQGEYALTRQDMHEKDEAVAQMLDKTEEMRALVDQLLMIARMDAGQLDCSQVCRLDEMLAEIAQEMEPVAWERGMGIDTDLMPCSVPGNRGMLMRAAVNLVDNAIRYGREGGKVRIRLLVDADACVISVEDDGEGIAREDLPKVFERFWRADGARTTQGTGIGLAIVQAAARAHGGSAGVQSEAGEGSRFTIRLPLKRADTPKKNQT